MSTVATTCANLAESYRSSAVIYRAQAAQYTPGSLGEVGNTAEAVRYEGMAGRFDKLAGKEATK